MSSSKISIEQLKHIAKLARLEIKPEQENYLSEQLSETAAYIDILGELDTKNVEPTFQTNHLKNVTRDDVIGESLTQSDALSQAKDTYNGYFKTQATISKK
jgi:aspartyl-tRNA(Asn)/glutamyl-tRNA(Gln) amidotransferase subunit C